MNDKNQSVIAGLQSGANNFYEELYKDYYPSVEKFILGNSGTVDDAKDIFQDTMMVLIEKIRLDHFTLTASLKTYIIAISKNLWFKKLRNLSNYCETEVTENLSYKFFNEVSSSIEREKTYWEKLHDFMNKITAHCNHLLHAMFFKNKNIQEIQLEFGYSTKHNAQNQKHKCIQQLRKVKEADSLTGI